MEKDLPANPVLAANMKRLMAGRSIGALRQQMAQSGLAIGQETIQRAVLGKTGNRLESLQKLAAFFGVAADQLLQEELGADSTSWPFSMHLLERISALEPEELLSMERAMWAHLNEDMPQEVVAARQKLRQLGAGVNNDTRIGKARHSS